jgi:hypothetical protein
MPKIDESWDYQHYEEAWGVWLWSQDEGGSPPAAVFTRRDDAENWLTDMRTREFEEDLKDAMARNLPRPIRNDAAIQGHYLRDASILPVRNAYLPVWNSYEDLPEIDPPAVPDWAMDDLRRAYVAPEPVNIEFRQKAKELKRVLREFLELSSNTKE